MSRRVLAIGLDAAEPSLLEEWCEAGELPVLTRLRAAGAYAPLRHREICRSETLWTMVQTGCEPERTGYWLQQRFDPQAYAMTPFAPYEFRDIPPFYALGETRRVIAFDIPQSRPSPNVSGTQVIAWGVHSPMHPFAIHPPELGEHLRQAYGPHPSAAVHYATLWRRSEVERLYRPLLLGAQRRAHICLDLMQGNEWDLCVVVFAETHLGGHYLSHVHDRTHPYHRPGEPDLLLDVYRAVDAALGQIVAAAPPDTHVVVFSAHGIETSSADLPSSVFLPELLYRHSFPGRCGLVDRRAASLPPIEQHPPRGWVASIWNDRAGASAWRRLAGRHLPLGLAYRLERLAGLPELPRHPLAASDGHQPPLWYQPAWPQMKAFALPSFSEGYVRINLRGREAAGIVEPAEYDALCKEISDMLRELVDPRSGESLVENIVRPRRSPQDTDRRLPDPDLIVVWKGRTADVVDSPRLGRIGPLPLHRAASHSTRGFVTLTGPDITPQTVLPEGRPVDLAPTILRLLGVTPPEYMDGRSLV